MPSAPRRAFDARMALFCAPASLTLTAAPGRLSLPGPAIWRHAGRHRACGRRSLHLGFAALAEEGWRRRVRRRARRGCKETHIDGEIPPASSCLSPARTPRRRFTIVIVQTWHCMRLLLAAPPPRQCLSLHAGGDYDGARIWRGRRCWRLVFWPPRMVRGPARHASHRGAHAPPVYVADAPQRPALPSPTLIMSESESMHHFGLSTGAILATSLAEPRLPVPAHPRCTTSLKVWRSAQ